jgi:hypothetical protein
MLLHHLENDIHEVFKTKKVLPFGHRIDRNYGSAAGACLIKSDSFFTVWFW